MKQKAALLIAGLFIYFIFGIVMVLVAGQELSSRWGFIAIWTVGMAFVHAFIMEPFRQRLSKKNQAKGQNK